VDVFEVVVLFVAVPLLVVGMRLRLYGWDQRGRPSVRVRLTVAATVVFLLATIWAADRIRR